MANKQCAGPVLGSLWGEVSSKTYRALSTMTISNFPNMGATNPDRKIGGKVNY